METKYFSYWELADKSSTIEAKRDYLEKFESALDHGYRIGDFAEYDATSLKTPNNSFTKNLSALRTLVNRLTEISKMDVSSFQYILLLNKLQGKNKAKQKK